MSKTELNKNELQMLEKVFAAEIEGRLPFQTTSKMASKLAEAGYLEQGVTMMSNLKVEGYWLTDAGRYIYCSSCRDVEIPE